MKRINRFKQIEEEIISLALNVDYYCSSSVCLSLVNTMSLIVQPPRKPCRPYRWSIWEICNAINWLVVLKHQWITTIDVANNM